MVSKFLMSLLLTCLYTEVLSFPFALKRAHQRGANTGAFRSLHDRRHATSVSALKATQPFHPNAVQTRGRSTDPPGSTSSFLSSNRSSLYGQSERKREIAGQHRAHPPSSPHSFQQQGSFPFHGVSVHTVAGSTIVVNPGRMGVSGQTAKTQATGNGGSGKADGSPPSPPASAKTTTGTAVSAASSAMLLKSSPLVILLPVSLPAGGASTSTVRDQKEESDLEDFSAQVPGVKDTLAWDLHINEEAGKETPDDDLFKISNSD
uniref:Uncharacterized protein n=1 Tax=Chromera velia CCMP2878 TaxID=1169474 RepID=A0A0G4GR24_9ALVE|eukprot:Cvel_5082.t1-p1 / transcript=Cvel_5082.t1 / gene=Cvel_5082 / organism=Chromera_velia_CCMP2878 / gene_product=hypothetical protein / transcript_product=hypothetical protein / location=Cvel_scaffold231:85946-86728(-) / protein_length=261 / sequence_SO=supercontig / SO=protein_coding / is_pseudo=false